MTPSEQNKRNRQRHIENYRATARRYCARNRARISEYAAKLRLLNKEAAVNVYTNGEGTCRWCGQGDIDVLCLDHIANDGYALRTLPGRYLPDGDKLVDYLRKNDYPEGIQVLCANCNTKKHVTHTRAMRQHRNAALTSGAGSLTHN